MYIQLSQLKTNPAKYFDLAKTDNIIVTRHGQRLGRIICEEEAVKTEKQKAVERLLNSVKNRPEHDGSDSYYNEVKEARLHDKGLL
ncbi:MAG: type II toxin-antitoxin system Phd/YefM family antitoxin [Oscillospiraceae bacterium]|jgi:hypothetical protein|nr:type II toxin-antitoxin system Phd/YefM family antitoxin [Oscillospiraceae bacterium]